jgi:RNA-binding protein
MPSVDPVMRRALRARAHHLHPVVTVGQHGLTPAVLREIDVALKAHELIKVRVFSDDRHARSALLDEICAALGAAPVQHLGKLLVLWRAEPEPGGETSKPAPVARTPRRRAASTKVPAAQPRPPKRRGTLAPDRTARGGSGVSGSRRGTRDRGVPAAAKAATGGRAPRAAATGERMTGGAANPRAPRGVPRAAMPRRRRSTGGTG